MPLSFSGGFSLLIVEYVAEIENFKLLHWLLVYSIVVLTMALALTPTTIIALLSGYFLGFEAITPVVLSYSLASLGGFYLSHILGGNFQQVIQRAYPKINDLIHRMSDKSPTRFVVFSRISPILPFAVMNLILPFIGIRLKPFFWGGLIGMLPRTILAITTGKLAKDLYFLVENPTDSLYMQIGFAGLLIASVLGFVALYRRNTKE
jgi:uncharacterized membrane protein YdjX (TVP38/TMEM64 family)